jgi:hypothetical protein
VVHASMLSSDSHPKSTGEASGAHRYRKRVICRK